MSNRNNSRHLQNFHKFNISSISSYSIYPYSLKNILSCLASILTKIPATWSLIFSISFLYGPINHMKVYLPLEMDYIFISLTLFFLGEYSSFPLPQYGQGPSYCCNYELGLFADLRFLGYVLIMFTSYRCQKIFSFAIVKRTCLRQLSWFTLIVL